MDFGQLIGLLARSGDIPQYPAKDLGFGAGPEGIFGPAFFFGAHLDSLVFFELGRFTLPDFLVMGEANGLVSITAQMAEFRENWLETFPVFLGVRFVFKEQLGYLDQFYFQERGQALRDGVSARIIFKGVRILVKALEGFLGVLDFKMILETALAPSGEVLGGDGRAVKLFF